MTTQASTRPRVLLVDDDRFMLRVQALMLEQMGFERVATADCAQQALAVVTADPESVDVIVCDLNMPGMDGIEFLQALNASALRVAIVVLSGEGTRILHTVQKLLGHGSLQILGALEKPAAGDALMALLARWRPAAAPVDTARAAVRAYTATEVLAATQAQPWVLHYQPKVDVLSGNLNGVEALIRWQHPVDGLVYPDSFIGVAEECGAIKAITEWVCADALRQQVRWRADGIHVTMAVNVSTENLRSVEFPTRLCALARELGAAPEDVILEITESRLMAPSATPLESLVRLRLKRFGLSIDDFGTGHSSLAQLRDVPFSELKVDRSFVRGARDNSVIRPMLEGSVGIAKRLGMSSVAEGVETEEDWHAVHEAGCDLAQGYFIGRPMPAERLHEWMADWRTRREKLVAR